MDVPGIVEILKTEYGIETMEQLQEAILKLGLIDISTFCSTPPIRKESAL